MTAAADLPLQHWPASRATSWRLKTRSLDLPPVPLLMGILNVTPDSFSDGGQFADVSAAVDRGLQLLADGADLLDIGGESTRPYSQAVAVEEELRRVVPVIERLKAQTGTPLSIDTSKAIVARHCLQAGAEIINDVTALQGDPRMLELAVELQAGVCAMHMQGTPQTMQVAPTYSDIVREIGEYLRQRRDALLAAGIDRQRICLDPGIGFGKTHQHNLALLSHCRQYHELGCPLLVGPSRKGFIGKVLEDKGIARDAGTAGVCLALARQGVQILRVHNVALVRQALQLFVATGGVDGAGLPLVAFGGNR